MPTLTLPRYSFYRFVAEGALLGSFAVYFYERYSRGESLVWPLWAVSSVYSLTWFIENNQNYVKFV